MRKFKLKKWVAAGMMVSLPHAGMVDAAGLGRLNVLSQLGHPFVGEIDLVNVTREEAATLKASLAPPTAYQAANLQFNPALNALRLTVERRTNGTSYIKATTLRPVTEPFLDLLVELSWQGGKIVREYSALLDPPGMQAPAAATTAPATAPVARDSTAIPAPAPQPTPEPARPTQAAPARAPASAQTAPPGQYAVRQGDTLSGIARQVGPQGVSLEQTLIGLFRANPDAFFGGNINQLRAGKILNLPEREQLASISRGEAAEQVRVHASNWNAYRRRVADTAPAVAEATPSSKGRITARVDDNATAAAPRDVVVLSKGDGAAGAAATGGKSAADRVRALEEDLAARDKALAEAKGRVAQLEKTLQEMQKLAEVKSAALASAAKGAEPKADAKPVPTPPEAKAEASTVAEAPKAPEAPATPQAPPPKAAAPAPKKIVAPPPPPPEPDVMDTVMENIVPIGGAAAALLAGIGGLWWMRRRKRDAEDDDDVVAPIAPRLRPEPAGDKVAADVKPEPALAAAAAVAVPDVTVASAADVVDPIDEAQVYIDHGRDAQAEEILKDALAKYPEREDIPLKLLEVYAGRGDKTAFNTLAGDFHKQTGGVGEKWGRAAALGYAIDPTNPLYPSTGDVVDLAAPREAASAVDLDLGGTPTDTMEMTTNILLEKDDSGMDMEKTMVLTRDDIKPPVPPAPDAPTTALPEFNLELPAATAPPEPAPPSPPPASSNMLEFNIDVPPASAPAPVTAAPAAKAEDAGLDFKVDFSNISLNLDDAAPAAPAAAAGAAMDAGGKDAHWEDVQQKFDLARAYQEMGDKEGAIEILHEVEREGDDTQKAEAQKLLQSLK